jgi:hypothetical protein
MFVAAEEDPWPAEKLGLNGRLSNDGLAAPSAVGGKTVGGLKVLVGDRCPVAMPEAVLEALDGLISNRTEDDMDEGLKGRDTSADAELLSTLLDGLQFPGR